MKRSFVIFSVVAVLSTMGFAATAAPVDQPTTDVAVDATPQCSLPDASALRADAVEMDGGHMSYEDWIANDESQEVAARVHEQLDALPRTVTSKAESPEAEPLVSRLANGVIGVTEDHVNQTVVVVVDPAVVDAKSVEEALRPVSAGLRVVIRPGCHSIAELDTADELIRERDWHPDASQVAFGFYIDPGTSSFRATFSSDDAEVAESLQKALGDIVQIEYGEPSRLSRLSDGEPHYGGAGIGTYNNNFCTSGFTIVKSGADGSVTAGHCYSNGTSVYSGTQYYGYTTGKASFPTYDMIRIASSVETYSNKIHVDPCCPSVRTVVSRGDTNTSAYVCVSGMVTRAKCGIDVVSMSATFCDASGCTPNLVYGERTGVVISQPGDSGAPMYNRWSNNRAAIRGMLIAHDSSDDIYAHKISRMESILGMTVDTS